MGSAPRAQRSQTREWDWIQIPKSGSRSQSLDELRIPKSFTPGLREWHFWWGIRQGLCGDLDPAQPRLLRVQVTKGTAGYSWGWKFLFLASTFLLLATSWMVFPCRGSKYQFHKTQEKINNCKADSLNSWCAVKGKYFTEVSQFPDSSSSTSFQE